MVRKLRIQYPGAVYHVMNRGDRRVVEGLKRLGWSEADLKARRKGEPRKVELAWELRSHTTMPLAWIAQRLNLGSRGHLAWLLQHRGLRQNSGRRMPNDWGRL